MAEKKRAGSRFLSCRMNKWKLEEKRASNDMVLG